MALFQTLTPRHRRCLGALIVVCVATAVSMLEYSARNYRYRWVEAEVRKAGGELPIVRFVRFNWLPDPWRRYFCDSDILAYLTGDTIDGEWLKQRDDLTAVHVETLSIYKSRLTGPDVARLVRKHPIHTLVAHNVTEADAIADALSTGRPLSVLRLCGSDLTDVGFRRLPLERLTGVGVPGSAVTSTALLDFRRCTRLQHAELDGRQFDDAVADLLFKELKITTIALIGPEVTDEHLARLHGRPVGRVTLIDTATTQAGIATLRAALPGCRIHVLGTPETTE